VIKTKVSIERQINERQYQFLCPYEASFEEAIYIIDDIRKYFSERMEEVKKQQAEEKPKEE